MKVLKSKRKGNTVSLEVEASLDTIEQGLTKVFKDYVKSASIPGFRKGKAPRHIFEKHYGKEILLKDGITEAINIAYFKAIQAEKLEVVDYPKNMNVNEYKEGKPVVFTCDVDVKPDVKIEKYKGVKVESESDEVSDDLINAQLRQLQISNVSYDIVDRVIEKDDLLKVNVDASINGETFSRWTKENVGVGVGSSIFSEKFDNQLIGKKKDDETSFTVDYPEDHYLKEVAGQTVSFKVVINEVKGKTEPELTDEFVQKVAKVESLELLKTNIRTSLEEKRKKDVDEKLKESILTAILEKNEFDVPEGMVSNEIARDRDYFANTLKQSGTTLESYLTMVKQTQEEFDEKLKENALKRLKSNLVLESIEKQENIEASHEEVLAEVKTMRPELDTDEKVEKELSKFNQEGLQTMVKQRKTFDFLIEHAKIVKKKS